MPTTTSFITRDGLKLLVRRWEPEGRPWARALIVHGLSEHSGRHDRIGTWLARAGIDALAYDQRGWGGSDGTRGDVERWADLLDDLDEALRFARGQSPGPLPLVLYGHSMGGLVCADYATSGRPLPDLLVLSAPGIDSTHGRFVRMVASTTGRLAPTMRPPVVPEHPELLCHDPEVGRAFHVDPLAVHRPTARFGARAFSAQRDVRDRLEAIVASGRHFPLPTLVIHGEEDAIVPPGATERLATVPGVTRRAYPGLRHELHHETEGEQVVADVIAWIRVHADREGDRPAGAVAATPADDGTAPTTAAS
jgi:alpha-beta hydrolase superfamily lysophospholipase